MIELIYLMIGSSLLGYFAGKEKRNMINNQISGKASNNIVYTLLITIICVGFIMFSGLRTSYNDTGTYLRGFNLFIQDDLSFSIKDLLKTQYYGFDFWQRLIKHFFEKGQWLLMVNAIVTNIVYIKYLSKYSETMGMTMLCYITIGTYIMSMAAQKQLLAMTISLIAIEFLLKHNYVMFYALIILAYTFHPYILTMTILPFLQVDVWSKRMIWISLIAAVLSFLFVQFIAVLLNLAENTGIGKDYSVEEMTSHTINPMRVIIDGIPILVSWLLRKEINKKANPFMKLAFNMMTVTWLLTFASLFGNPIYLYRTGQYFASYIPVVVPWMLVYCLPNSQYKKLIIIGYMAVYIAVCTQQIIQFGGYKLTYDPFRHTTLSSLFK